MVRPGITIYCGPTFSLTGDPFDLAASVWGGIRGREIVHLKTIYGCCDLDILEQWCEMAAAQDLSGAMIRFSMGKEAWFDLDQ